MRQDIDRLPWMSGETLNYYYFGHVVLAWPIKVLGLAPDTGYLLSWGLVMGLTATAVYAFSGPLFGIYLLAMFNRPASWPRRW